MNASEKYYGELPNLSFVQKLALTDADFQEKFVDKVKIEFSKQYNAYQDHIELAEPRAAAEIVQKLKYTFGFLGMPKSLEIANNHQELLHVGNVDMHHHFGKILSSVKDFLSKH